MVSATQDLTTEPIITWWNAQDSVSNAANYNTAGQAFTDWRLPTRHELRLLWGQKDIVGGFVDGGIYWSSSENINEEAFVQYFPYAHGSAASKNLTFRVRAVRSF